MTFLSEQPVMSGMKIPIYFLTLITERNEYGNLLWGSFAFKFSQNETVSKSGVLMDFDPLTLTAEAI